jgi:DNA-binding phage protein
MGDQVSDGQPDPGEHLQAENLTDDSALVRLRTAVREAGGLSQVSNRAGIPTRSLSHYLEGREMRVGTAAALADACRVQLEWLATGRGPKHVEHYTPDPADQLPAGATVAVGPTMPLPHGAFGHLNVDRMAEALRRAQRLYEEEKRAPSPRRFAQILLLLYDEITEEAAATPATQPDDAPVNRD